jgi:hypothetical protein
MLNSKRQNVLFPDSKTLENAPLNNDPGYASIERTDPNLDEDCAQWGQRHSRLSFETFKGPQSGSDPDSSASHSPDSTKSGSDHSSTRGIPTKVNRQSSFEVIYSQVNKKRPRREEVHTDTSDADVSDTSDRNNSPDQKKLNPVSNDFQEVNEDCDSLLMSFDDVLASLKLSYTDLVVEDESGEPILDQNSEVPVSEEIPKPREPDLVPDLIHMQEAYSATPSPQDGLPIDIDLMMSDEIIFRARKKSVTFNDVIQERPVSMGESDATLDETPNGKGTCKRSLPNGVYQSNTNGVIPQNKVADFVTDDHQEIKTIIENAKYVTVIPAHAQMLGTGNDEVISVTSFDAFESDEEDLLKKETPKVKRLMKIRSILLMLTWFCLVSGQQIQS